MQELSIGEGELPAGVKGNDEAEGESGRVEEDGGKLACYLASWCEVFTVGELEGSLHLPPL